MSNSSSDLFIPRRFDEVFKDVTIEEWNDPRWQRINSITSADPEFAVQKLEQIIKLNDIQKSGIIETIRKSQEQGNKVPMLISPYYSSLMAEDPFFPKYPDEQTLGNKIDPIFWQAVPTPANFLFPDAGIFGAMGEDKRTYGAAYQRYGDRVALFVGNPNNCGTFCQQCQRGASLDDNFQITPEDIAKGLHYIKSNENIREVLVTGGDALRISPKRLEYILTELNKIDHLKSIRIATRTPVTMPMGVTDELLDIVNNSKEHQNSRKNIYFMTHINHYHEITPDFVKAVDKIRARGYSVYNQMVLMNHVNSDYKTLGITDERMFQYGVKPHYLFQCHNERGLTHFISQFQIGEILASNLRGFTLGMDIPNYMVNLEGGGGKIRLTPPRIQVFGDVQKLDEKILGPPWTVSTWDGKVIDDYYELGGATSYQYYNAIRVMNNFLGRDDIFKPQLVISDKRGDMGTDGNYMPYLENVTLPRLTNEIKSSAFGYKVENDGLPLNNPQIEEKKLNEKFKYSDYYKHLRDGLIAK